MTLDQIDRLLNIGATPDNWSLILHQKKVAEEVLSKVRTKFPTAVVMGGAPRDWFLHKPATDIDIYVQTSSSTNLGYVLEQLGFNTVEVKRNSNYADNTDIIQVVQSEVNGVVIQFIHVNIKEYEAMQKFPFGICKISYTPEKGIEPSSNFMNCLDNKLLVVTNPLYADGAKYIQKIKQKFPEFAFYASTEDYAKSKL
jgi:hypothetical protein